MTDDATIKAALLYGGLKIITSAALLEKRPYPRSPARARRRAAMGHRQHTRDFPSRTGYMISDHTMVVHPMMYAECKRAAVAAQEARR
jgi:hypothetical protein